jgi:hypothetical protein
MPGSSRWSKTMLPRTEEASDIANPAVWLRISATGAAGVVDPGNGRYGEVFQPPKARDHGKGFRLHPELRTLVWPGGADSAPAFLRSALRAAA